MEIIHKKNKWKPMDGEFQNCIVLYDDNWNDYCYRTTFHVVYFDINGHSTSIGDIKIYYYDYDKNRTEDYGNAVSNQIGDKILQLNHKFCSLGQDLNYYCLLKKILPDDFNDILNRLNDISINEQLRDQFIREDGVQTSLLRSSSAVKALKEANALLNSDARISNDMSFDFLTKLPYSNERTEIKFDFQKNDDIPYRINVLVGKNGVGKTQILSHIADSLSGFSSLNDKKDSFKDYIPPVDKVISVSFSAFDEFRKRNNKNLISKTSYCYCGIQSDHGTLSINELKDNFLSSLNIIKERERLKNWKTIMQVLFEKEHIDLLEQASAGNIDSIHLSSGQYILLCTMTEIISKIEKESLLLFDEPELHLHPNAVANTLRMLYKLLEEFDSYAIFATHSPLIIQEIPSKYIRILSKIDNVLDVRKPSLECFGENVTNITNDVFDVNETESNFKTVLRQLSKKMNFNEVLKIFDGNLSFNAMIYLKSCYIEE